MKITHDRFAAAFRSLKNQIDQIPLSAYQREEILQNMAELRNEFERTLDAQNKKPVDKSP